MEQDYFSKRELVVEPVCFALSPEIGTALPTGDVRFGASIAYSVVLSTQSRDPGQLRVFIVESETPDNYLSSFAVLRDSGITTLADLRGKSVASFPGSTARAFGAMVLEKHGLRPGSDLEFFEFDAASHLAAT